MWTQTFARWMKCQKAYDAGEISDLFLAIEEKRQKELEWEKDAQDHKQRQGKRDYD